MKSPLYKLVGIIGLATLTLNAYADQGGGNKEMGMGSMKMDCSKHMENMKGMEGMKMDCMGKTGASQSLNTNEGEVKAVDKASKSITLKHGPIKSKTVEMTPMTMSFAVQQPALLSNVKVGDKVKFTIENIDSVPTVTGLNVQK